jgi:type IV pilus assembly protein PilC
MLFYYKAKKLSGEETEGEREAKDRFDLARLLKKDGFILVSFEEKKPARKETFSFFSFLAGIPATEKMIFSRNLSVMIGAGVSLHKALKVLTRQTNNKKFKKILESISDEIKKGSSFSDALKKYPNIFSHLFVAMVNAGEKTGKLEESLNSISDQLKRDYELKRRVKGALMYPAIIMFAMVGIGVLMMIYVVPTLTSTFEDLGVDLPATTKFVIFMSDFIVGNKILFLLIVSAVFGLLWYLIKIPANRKLVDYVILHIPLISPIVKKVNTARTARTLGSLLDSGVNILESLEVCKGVLQNQYYKDILKETSRAVEKGEPASKVFLAYPKLYPLLLGEMAAVGEETGKMPEMLFRIADFYENEVAVETKDMSTIIEPILMIIIGIVVGFFAVSMIQPMYSMMGSL